MDRFKLRRVKAMILIIMISLSNFAFSQEKTYNVGDLYEKGDVKGIVFEVNAQGTHGKIISLDETIAPWVAFLGATYIQVGSTYEDDGAKNMKIIMNASGWQETYTAAYWCYKHGEKWYLPSRTELKIIFTHKETLNKTLASIEGADEIFPAKPPKGSDVYISSTELSNAFLNIYAVNKKGKSSAYGFQKNYTGMVRAVYKF